MSVHLSDCGRAAQKRKGTVIMFVLGAVGINVERVRVRFTI